MEAGLMTRIVYVSSNWSGKWIKRNNNLHVCCAPLSARIWL